MTTTTWTKPHYASRKREYDESEECAECGHFSRYQVPDCPCGQGTESACDPRLAKVERPTDD